MHKKIKIILSFFFIFIINLFFSSSFAKYTIEDIFIIAKLDIDRCKPDIELIDLISSNSNYPTYANKTHIITGHLKITEKNIIKNNLSANSLKILVGNHSITPTFKNFSLISQNLNTKIYEFSFTNTINDGPLTIVIPKGIVEDKSGLINDQKNFSTNIFIDNTPPNATFLETPSSNNKAKIQITSDEAIQPMEGWTNSSNHLTLEKEFSNPITYALPLTDFAQNSSELLITIKNASNILLEYGTFDDYSYQTLVSSGEISSPKTISSHSICTTESIFIRFASNFNPNFLQAKSYVHTYWGNGAQIICPYTELICHHGFNEWITVSSQQALHHNNHLFSQLGAYRFKCTQ